MAFSDLVERADRAIQSSLGSVVFSYRPRFGDRIDNLRGIFDENYILHSGGEVVGVEDVAPAIFFRIGDLGGSVDVESDDPCLTIDGGEYTVRERRIDRVGGSVLLILYLAD